MIGYYTLLPASCSESNLSTAVTVNDPAHVLASWLIAAAAAVAENQAVMTARLDTVQPLLAALLSEPPAALSIVGINASAPFVWLGVQGVICYHVPPSANVNTKVLTLYVGDGSSGTYYPGVLGASSGVLPADAQGCVNFTILRGVPIGEYTLALENPAMGQTFTTYTLYLEKATLLITALSLAGPTTLIVRVNWNIPVARATTSDMIRAVNIHGVVAAWVYTSCQCQTQLVSGAAVAASGSVLIKLTKATVLGGCTFELKVGDLPAAVAPNMIPWARIGWG